MNRNLGPATVSWLIRLDYFNLISITQSVADTFALMMLVRLAFGAVRVVRDTKILHFKFSLTIGVV